MVLMDTNGERIAKRAATNVQSANTDEARAKRQATLAARKAGILRSDFLDADNWARLASERHLYLPKWGTPCTTGIMRRWLRKLSLSVEWYRNWSGFGTLAQWPAENPLWPARAFAGLLLEEAEAAGR